MAFTQRLLKTSSFCLIGSASTAVAASGAADILSTLIFVAAFVAGWFVDTVRLRRRLPRRLFAFAVIVYLCFMPADRFLLSSDWPRVLLHAIWFAAAVKLVARTGDKDWPALYFLASIQWIIAAAQPTGTTFWICLAVFIVSGILALMLFEATSENPGLCVTLPRQNAHLPYVNSAFVSVASLDSRVFGGCLELRRPTGITSDDARNESAAEENSEKSVAKSSQAFPARTLFMAATGIAAAVMAASIPLFFFLPRLPAATGAQLPSDTESSFDDYMEDVETMEIGRSGPPRQPDAIVMRVKTDAPLERLPYDLKWRGLSYDYYDGREWRLYRREQQPVATQGRFYKLEESAMGSELLQQTFFMEETLAGTIFAAHRALAVSTDAGFLRRDSSDNLFAQYPARSKTNYTVVSDTILPDADKISGLIPIPDDIRSTWLQLPEMDPRVVRLAREITRKYRRQYDKARALEIWLGSNYGYTETLPEIYENPENGDPLAVFLFDAREGHCEYFATAMTVMLRAIGIPARITSGFLAGEYNPIGGSWTVRRKYSHTWTEAWFPPYGWIEFDATPAWDFPSEPPRVRFFANFTDAVGLWWRENVVSYDAARQYSVISGFFTRVNQAEDRAGEFFSSSAARARAVFNILPRTAGTVAAAIVLCIAVSGILIIRRRRRRIIGAFRRSKQNPRTSAAGFYAEALTLLKARGLTIEKSRTPLEFAQSLGADSAAAALFDLTRFYNEVRFGNTAQPFPRAEARALLRSLKTALGK